MSALLIYLTLLVFLIFVINYFAKREVINREFARKLTHIVTGITACTFPLFLIPMHIMILSGVFVVLMGISKLTRILSLNKVERVTWGEVYFPIGVGICALLSLPQNLSAYFVGILCLTFADTTANIIGHVMPIKVINIGTQTKSIGGFLACVIMVLVIFSIFFPVAGYSWLLLIAISLIIGLIEVVSIYGTDNITVPTAATFLSFMISYT